MLGENDYYTVDAESIDWSLFVDNFFPVKGTTHKFFLLTVQASVMSWAKFHHSRIRTFCLRPGGMK